MNEEKIVSQQNITPASQQDSTRYFELKYNIFELYQQISALRKEMKQFDNDSMLNLVQHQPGNLLPLSSNVVVTYDVKRSLTPINQQNLYNLLLKFWRDVEKDATDDQVLEKAQQQYDILLGYREYETEHILKVRRVPDVAKLLEQRQTHKLDPSPIPVISRPPKRPRGTIQLPQPPQEPDNFQQQESSIQDSSTISEP